MPVHYPHGPVRCAAVAGRLVEKLDRFQRRWRWAGFPLAVVYKFADDQGSYLAALIAYYGFLSLFPLFLLLVTILGFVLQDDPELQEQAPGHGAGAVPGDRYPAARQRARAPGQRRRRSWSASCSRSTAARRRAAGAERVQPRVGGAAQPAPEPDQVPPAQPAAAARARASAMRGHHRARRPHDERERVRRRQSTPCCACCRSCWRSWPTSACSWSPSGCSPRRRCPRVTCASAPSRRAWAGRWLQVLGTYLVTRLLRGTQRGLRRVRPRTRPDRVDLPAGAGRWCSPPRSTSSRNGACGRARC